MSADAFADEAGRFMIEITDYRTGARIGLLYIADLEPFGPVQIEILNGTDYLPDEAQKDDERSIST